MTKVENIIHNAQLVTCASGGAPKKGARAMQDAGIIERGAVAFTDGKIVAVGKSEDVLRQFEAENELDAGGNTVAPAFVEAHTHIVFAGNRLDEFELKIKGADYLEILKNGGGILSTVRQTRAAALDVLIAESRRRLDKMFALGVGTCEIKTGYGLDTETELKMLEAIFALRETHQVDIVPTFLAAHAVPPEFKENPDAYVDLICTEMLPLVNSRFQIPDSKLENSEQWTVDSGQILDSSLQNTTNNEPRTKTKDQRPKTEAQNPFPKIFVDVFCEKGAFDLKQSRRVLETAKALGFGLKAHVDEFTNLGGARAAIELGAVSIDHLDAISDEEIRLLAESDTIGVVTPTVNFNFGAKEFADARKLIDAGCAIAVSTDYNPGSAPCPSVSNAMAISCRYQKLLPAESFNAATINAAYAVGRGRAVGSLETGKQADLLVFDTRDYREIVYEFGGNLIEKIIKKGEYVETQPRRQNLTDLFPAER